MKPLETPRECRQRLNRLEGWFRGNQNRFSPTEQVVLRSLFEIAETPSDVVNMGEALRERVRPETQDRAAQPSLTPGNSPAPLTSHEANAPPTIGDLAVLDKEECRPEHDAPSGTGMGDETERSRIAIWLLEERH